MRLRGERERRLSRHSTRRLLSLASRLAALTARRLLPLDHRQHGLVAEEVLLHEVLEGLPSTPGKMIEEAGPRREDA